MVVQALAAGADTVLDIGANRGQFGERVLAAGFAGHGRVISFEPLADAHEALVARAAAVPNWQVFRRCAVGDADGLVTINVAENEHSSSLLKVAEIHTRAAPTARQNRAETVPSVRLDSISSEIGTGRFLLKIDTQGFEDRVLAGAIEHILPATVMLQLELSLQPLYEEQKTIEVMLPHLMELGFTPAFFSPGYTDRTTQEMQQVEGYFVRTNH